MKLLKADCCLFDWKAYQGAGQKLDFFPPTCCKGIGRLIRAILSRNLDNNGNKEAGTQIAATRDEVSDPACACGRRLFGKKLKVSFLEEN